MRMKHIKSVVDIDGDEPVKYKENAGQVYANSTLRETRMEETLGAAKPNTLRVNEIVIGILRRNVPLLWSWRQEFTIRI